ncbi:amino acid ABC transporter substrate-binding protein [Geminocystis herdmanii]|uniref:amino acid ABC transporter substrate-binding protein n=1 Tax=Geminocystis herdmanii TaxID=669359 RepID=UPI00034A1539|nr:amino acid ABC transporter substrate-binding protein [Geminocystis herdmanii]
MFNKLISIVLSCSVIFGVQVPVLAGEIFNQIEKTGVIKAGYREDTPPFAFVDDKGKPVGYSLDILELVRQETERRLGKPIKLELIVVDPDTRFDKIKDGTIHIECGSTTVTWEREKTVDFAVSYFASGTQMIVKKGSGFANSDNLKGAKIGVIPNTTNEKAMRIFAQGAQLIFFTSEEDGMEKLTKGEIDGFAGDGILLQNLKKQANNSQQYEIVPEFPYMIESYACTIPENDSAWRTTVNYSIVKFMQGVVTDTPSAIDIYDRWFGVNGNTPYPIETMADYFQGIINGYEWINIDERY